MQRRVEESGGGETPGPVRLTVVAYGLLVVEVVWLVAYGAFTIQTGTDPQEWAGQVALALLLVAFGLSGWQLVRDWQGRVGE